jgi:hypothetical protein
MVLVEINAELCSLYPNTSENCTKACEIIPETFREPEK